MYKPKNENQNGNKNKNKSKNKNRNMLEGYVSRLPGWPLLYGRDISAEVNQDNADNKLGFFDRLNGKLDVEYIDARIRNLPREFEGYAIACVSDLHGGHAQTSPPLVRALAQIKPDLICMLGDTIDGGTDSLDNVIAIFQAFPAIAPTIAITGNNEYACGLMPSLKEAYAKAGIILLEDHSLTLRRGDASLRVVGIQDRYARIVRCGVTRSADTEGCEPVMPSAEPNTIQLLAIHRPTLAARYLRHGFHVALSGHAHGGQFRLFGRGIYSPGQGFLPRLTSGLYHIEGGSLIVSRGVGNHEFPLRINNPPHLPVVRLSALEGTGLRSG